MKWFCFAAIFVLPFVSYCFWHRAFARKPDSKLVRRLRPVIGVLCWFLVLFLMFFAQSFHEKEWWATRDHAAGMTEGDLRELGDYPNVFAGWLAFGWLPVLTMSLLAKFLNSRNRAQVSNPKA